MNLKLYFIKQTWHVHNYVVVYTKSTTERARSTQKDECTVHQLSYRLVSELSTVLMEALLTSQWSTRSLSDDKMLKNNSRAWAVCESEVKDTKVCLKLVLNLACEDLFVRNKLCLRGTEVLLDLRNKLCLLVRI